MHCIVWHNKNLCGTNLYDQYLTCKIYIKLAQKNVALQWYAHTFLFVNVLIIIVNAGNIHNLQLIDNMCSQACNSLVLSPNPTLSEGKGSGDLGQKALVQLTTCAEISMHQSEHNFGRST